MLDPAENELQERKMDKFLPELDAMCTAHIRLLSTGHGQRSDPEHMRDVYEWVRGGLLTLADKMYRQMTCCDVTSTLMELGVIESKEECDEKAGEGESGDGA